ncbi:Pachytene checkpoint protein 2-like [Lamellibrachia satsuma]|nr:Pachytene checkpoint protein 2-like [Lamellibrachia satsuma]
MDKHQVTDLQRALPETTNLVVHVEVCQKPCSTARMGDVKEHVKSLLGTINTCCNNFSITSFDDQFLQEHVRSVAICDLDLLDLKAGEVIFLSKCNIRIHVFQLNEDGADHEELDGEDLPAANHWLLPSSDFVGLWDSLIYDSSIKAQLLQYASTTLLFSDKHVDSNVVAWNRVILLHGPPGTGKTSLCKALAQKLTVNLSDRYSYGQLIEINSHSLFSKWFSESGKLVMKMFQKIEQLVDDPNSIVFVLMDEVESLTAARSASLGSTEPSDAIRVVNALLTQIDHIKQFPNVIILATSNITGAIDLAFVDRADIKQYIGPPSPSAIYKILQSCLNELMKASIISPSENLLDLKLLDTNLKVLEMMGESAENDSMLLSHRLKKISERCAGLSGRTLRKLPFITHAIFLQTSSVNLGVFLDALSQAVDQQFKEREHLGL